MNRSVYDEGGLSDFRGGCAIFDLDNGDLFIPDYVVQDELLPQSTRDCLEDGLLKHTYNNYSGGASAEFSSSKFNQEATRNVFRNIMTDLLSSTMESLDPSTLQFDCDAFLATQPDVVDIDAPGFFFEEFTQTQMFAAFTARVTAHCRGEKLDFELLKLDFHHQLRRGAFDAGGKSNGGRFDLLKHPHWLAETAPSESAASTRTGGAASGAAFPRSSTIDGFGLSRSMVEETLVGLDEQLRFEGQNVRPDNQNQRNSNVAAAVGCAFPDSQSKDVPLYDVNPGKDGSYIVPRLDFTGKRAMGALADTSLLTVRRDLRRAMYAETVAVSIRDAKSQLQDLKRIYSALNPIDDNLFALSAVTDTKVCVIGYVTPVQLCPRLFVRVVLPGSLCVGQAP